MVPRALLLVLITLCVVQAIPQNSDSGSDEHEGLIDGLFGIFKTIFGKQYDNEEAEAERKTTFVINIEKIRNHNLAFSNGTATYKRGANKYTDVDHEKFVRTMNGYKPSLRSSQNNTGDGKLLGSKQGLTITTYKPPANQKLPASVDWRTKGAVNPVKDQGQCGSCWSFSSTGSLEGQTKIKKGKTVDLSEQNLIDCSTAQGNAGCNGGLMEFAFRYIQSNGGVDSETSYPYEEEDGTCRYKKKNSAANVTAMVKIPPGDEKALQSAVATIGPISAGIDASQSSFQFYSSGVYFQPKCTTDVDHAVLIVGYGTENGLDYWLVKNSWGTDWGDNGYVKMARNKNNHCGIASTASYPVV